MRIISRKTLVDYWSANPRSEAQLKAWYAEADSATWTKPADVKDKYRNASILRDGRAVFNICGNDFRLVVWINYEFYTVYIRFIGTHTEYDKVDAQTI